jgi:hypothetical protein
VKKSFRKRITTNATTTIVSGSSVVHQIVISCHDAGTDWVLRIQDIASNPFVLIPSFTLSVPSDGQPNVTRYFDEPIVMDGGVNIVTANSAGSDTGEVFIWVIADKGGST